MSDRLNDEEAARLEADFTHELTYAVSLRNRGVTHVEASTAGAALAKGRPTVPIDEYVGRWDEALRRIRSGDRSRDLDY